MYTKWLSVVTKVVIKSRNCWRCLAQRQLHRNCI